jgi:hypothetical protein
MLLLPERFRLFKQKRYFPKKRWHREESASFLKKRSKTLLRLGAGALGPLRQREQKFFGVAFLS